MCYTRGERCSSLSLNAIFDKSLVWKKKSATASKKNLLMWLCENASPVEISGMYVSMDGLSAMCMQHFDISTHYYQSNWPALHTDIFFSRLKVFHDFFSFGHIYLSFARFIVSSFTQAVASICDEVLMVEYVWKCKMGHIFYLSLTRRMIASDRSTKYYAPEQDIGWAKKSTTHTLYTVRTTNITSRRKKLYDDNVKQKTLSHDR